MTIFGRRSAVVSVAGIVAECIDDGDAKAELIMQRLYDGSIEPSATDKLGFPRQARLFNVIDKAARLLRENKSFFDWAVGRLIRYKRVTTHEHPCQL